MVIATSDSCNTLITLEDGIKQVGYNSEGVCVEEEQYFKTEINLPGDDLFDFGDDVPQQPVYLPVSGRVDEYFRNIPQVVESCDDLLANPPRYFHKTSSERVLYVAQGEVAHAVPLQCDVLMSDKATTCHILAIRSESSDNLPLTSLTHIDGTSYDSCIRSMILEHVAHHQPKFIEEKKSDEDSFVDNRVNIQVHVVGGYEDKESVSSSISNWLINLLAAIAEEERHSLTLTLRTCAITSLNDNGYSSPIGRGLGIDLLSGEVFLAKASDDVAGPAVELRAVRLWSPDHKTLSVIHTARCNDLCVTPFTYEAFPEIQQLLMLPDNVMLQYTSTSPDVEEPGFCDSLRSTLRFLRDAKCSSVFGPCVDKPLIFRRAGASNFWKRIQ